MRNALLFSCAFLVISAPAQAAQKYTYKVYAGGIDAVRAYLSIEQTSKEHYDMTLDARTRGFLAKLAPWTGAFITKTRTVNGAFKPLLHKSVSTWRGETEVKEYRYGKNGQFEELVITEGEQAPKKETVAAELTKDTTDVLSATLDMLAAFPKNAENCTGQSEIFDGKRRFKMFFREQGKTMLQASRYNIYEGPATECTVEIEPAGGEWHEKPRGWLSIQEQGREKGTMPTIWIAKPDGQDIAIPVKVRVKTDYGTLFMHLAEM